MKLLLSTLSPAIKSSCITSALYSVFIVKAGTCLNGILMNMLSFGGDCSSSFHRDEDMVLIARLLADLTPVQTLRLPERGTVFLQSIHYRC